MEHIPRPPAAQVPRTSRARRVGPGVIHLVLGRGLRQFAIVYHFDGPQYLVAKKRKGRKGLKGGKEGADGGLYMDRIAIALERERREPESGVCVCGVCGRRGGEISSW